MSEHAKKGTNSATSGVVVGGGRRKLLPLRSRKAWLWLCVAVVAGVIFIGLVAWLFHDMHKNKFTGQAPKESAVAQSKQLVDLGNYAAAQQLLLQQIKADTPKDQQVTIYNELTVNAINAKKYDDALKYAQKVDRLAPTSDSAEQIGQIALKQGNTSLAAQYLNTAITRVTPTTPAGSLKVRQYKAELQAIGGKS